MSATEITRAHSRGGTTGTPLSPEAVALRRLLIEALYVEGALGYVTADVFLGRCPLCGGHVAVRFAGAAPRADLYCRGGCAEGEIAARLGLMVRR